MSIVIIITPKPKKPPARASVEKAVTTGSITLELESIEGESTVETLWRAADSLFVER